MPHLLALNGARLSDDMLICTINATETQIETATKRIHGAVMERDALRQRRFLLQEEYARRQREP